MNPPSDAEKEDAMERFCAQYLFPETLDAYLEERARTFRRTSYSTSDNPSWYCIVCQKTFSKKHAAKRHCETAHVGDGGDDNVQQQGRGKRIKTVTHDAHLDLVLPSGAVVCPPPLSTSASASSCCCQEECKSATTAVPPSTCCPEEGHIRVQHDDHEDLLVGGTLCHFNEERQIWENHGELWSLEQDLDYLLELEAEGKLQLGMPLPATTTTTQQGGVALPQGSVFFLGHTSSSNKNDGNGEKEEEEEDKTGDSRAISNVLEAMNACSHNSSHGHSHSAHGHAHRH